MKILNAAQIKEADRCSILLQKISSWDLMERASSAFVNALLPYVDKKNSVDVYCGKGNNGGDGLAIARMLAEIGFSIRVIIVEHTPNASQDFLINYDKIQVLGESVKIIHVEKNADLEHLQISNHPVCIDAILGSGVNKPAEGIIKEVIHHINRHYTKIFSVDVPSGLFLDKPNPENSAVVKADYTFTFQMPKLSFLFPENADYVGEWDILDIGLSDECIEKQPTDFYAIEDASIKSIYVPRKKTGLKWNFGHCLIIAGSKNMRGAAVLCTGAALKSGCGLASIHSVEKVVSSVIQKYPECILSIDSNEDVCSELPDISKYDAIAFGSGMGCNEKTYSVLVKLLKEIKKQKLVIDADGLNVIARYNDCIELLQNKQIILTPHIKEFDRIFGSSKNHFERIHKAIDIAKKLNTVIVLKSAYTAIVLPSGKVYFNIVANSGLAKGGSGDVLTGIMVSLCAKNYSIENAAILGVYIHLVAGLFAKIELHPESMLPSDVINHISDAFDYIENG
ncbi:MAG: bifunctional ADP-dependent NAD(P)H-hydrate dehydratase/NAD(P)H-hydrate epimerase [Bacteroidia bacterium]